MIFVVPLKYRASPMSITGSLAPVQAPEAEERKKGRSPGVAPEPLGADESFNGGSPLDGSRPLYGPIWGDTSRFFMGRLHFFVASYTYMIVQYSYGHP